MLKWLWGRPKDLQNPCGLTDQELKLLTEDLARLGKVKRDLSEKALRYVVDGEGPGVLGEIQKRKECGPAMSLAAISFAYTYDEWTSGNGDPRWRFFQTLTTDAPAVILRLAQLYSAVASTSSFHSYYGRHNVPDWLFPLLFEINGHMNHCTDNVRPNTQFRTSALEKVAVYAGFTPDFVVTTAFGLECSGYYSFSHEARQFIWLDGFAERVAVHQEAVKDALLHKKAPQRFHALGVLSASGADIEPFAEIVAELAVSSAKKVREAAESIVKLRPELFQGYFERKATDGSSDERANALRALQQFYGSESNAFLRKCLTSETSGKVRQQIQLLLGCCDESVPAQALPPIEGIDARAPLPEEAMREYWQLAGRCRQEIDEIYQKEAKRGRLAPKRVPSDAFDRILTYIQGSIDTPKKEQLASLPIEFHWLFGEPVNHLVTAFAAIPGVRLEHVVRMLMVSGTFPVKPLLKLWGQRHTDGPCLEAIGNKRGRPVCLRELAAVLSAIGMDPDVIGRGRLWDCPPPFVVSDELTWPYFAERLHLIEQALCLQPCDRYTDRGTKDRAFEILAMFPEPPAKLQPVLWDMALGSTKLDRPLAIKCLDKLPNKMKTIIEALSSKKSAARASAALWLADLGAKEAVPALQAALEKESIESARSAISNALHALTGEVDDGGDVGNWLREAEDGLKGGIPQALTGFPFEGLPLVHLADTRELLPREFLTWKLVQQCMVGNPEPGVSLLAFASKLNPADREALGVFVLKAWIDRDAKPVYTQEQAKTLADQQAKLWVKQYPEFYTYDSAYRETYGALIREAEGSAIKERGILALAGACGGAATAGIVETYLNQWYGYRAAQCKALLRMLSWVDQPTATQTLISVARRFRTAGIQEEAVACVKQLAERRGWTIEELGDRTIPTAGFDDNAEMVLDYGGRTFTARLDAQFNITLANSDGKTIKSLPEAAKTDSAELAKEAKKSLSNAKKELKTVLKMQKDRLYEAMCTERVWKLEDWDTYVNRHPIVRHYSSRLIWLAADTKVTFRPLGDGTLTDVCDEEVRLAPDTSIKLAHSVNVPDIDRQQWIAHFRDYEIETLFDQLSKPVLMLTLDQAKAVELNDYRGHMVDMRKFRSLAEKLGYVHAPAEDGACFCEHIKRLTGIGIEAVIESTPICLVPLGDHPPVALTSLFFRKMDDKQNAYTPAGKVPLGSVPAVLLSECWNDVKTIAADGTGFDPKWEEKTDGASW